MSTQSKRWRASARAKRPMVWKARLLLAKAKSRAKARGLRFEITLADISPLPVKCPVLGLALEYVDSKDWRARATLDRLDNRLGYVPGNVLVISYRANVLKSDATADELRRVAEYAAMPELL